MRSQKHPGKKLSRLKLPQPRLCDDVRSSSCSLMLRDVCLVVIQPDVDATAAGVALVVPLCLLYLSLGRALFRVYIRFLEIFERTFGPLKRRIRRAAQNIPFVFVSGVVHHDRFENKGSLDSLLSKSVTLLLHMLME